jgi:omega-amidase
MEPLRVTLVQADLVWEDPQANRDRLEAQLASLTGATDLVVLPEMFTTGFSMRSEALAEEMDGPSVRWMQGMAEKLGAVVAGSLIIRERGGYYNRLLWVRPNHSIQYYDKRHLFTLAGEHKHFSPGVERLLVEIKGWTVCPLICYDLRFPAWSRNTGVYDLLIYAANWPQPRRNAWQSLIIARAIENQSYALGVNRVGTDGNGHIYMGDTMAVNFAGETLCHAAQSEQCLTLSLDPVAQEVFRAQFAFLKDGDEFTIKV